MQGRREKVTGDVYEYTSRIADDRERSPWTDSGSRAKSRDSWPAIVRRITYGGAR